MKKKNTLHVKPLRRYNTPAYPSYLDKNPIEHPDTLPYPFTYKALQVLAGAGILVGSVAVSGCGVLSPFKFKDMNVPFRTSSFGTGTASRLSSEEAREVIDRVFKEEGIYLQKNYEYKKGEVSALLDGFDLKRNIGYVWIDGYKMGDDMMTSHQKTTAYKGIPDYSIIEGDADRIARFVKSAIEHTDNPHEFNKRFEADRQISIEDEKLLAYKALYLDILIADNREEKYKPDYEYIKLFLDSDIAFEEKEKIFILFRRLGRKVSTHDEKDILSEIISEIVSLTDEEERIRQYNNFSTFLTVNGRERYAKIENGPTQKILAIKDKKRMAEEIQRFGAEYLDQKISLEEAKRLQGMYKGDCIAPISIRDDRFYYQHHHHHRTPQLSKKQKRKLEKIKETARTDEEHRQASFQARAFVEQQIPNPHRETLKTLENQVRQYIQWARLQARY